ncbi:MAG: large terminase [Actinomycetes bacterium]
MAVLIVPELDLSFPTLGPLLEDFITDRCVFGPGSLAGQPARLDDEKRAALYRLYEVYPKGHRLEGRRRFQRGALEWRKGMAKTEFAAWVSFCELHPEAPVRCDGFNAKGEPVGRPVRSPYIPMMAVTEEQVSELAYGVLKYVTENGPDSGLFDSSLDRIIRLDSRGRDGGRAVPVSNAPGSRDGALTTFQHFDEPHRLFLPNQRHAHETMLQNLPKRQMEDPWAFYTSTAGAPGQNSIEEDVRAEAESISRGEQDDPSLFFFARWAGPEHDDLSTLDKRIAAVAEATGPAGEYGPGQFERIAKDYERKGIDRAYWERVYLNRWRRSGSQFFDMKLIEALTRPGVLIPDGAFVTLGFDGARFRDATALVATEIATGLQMLVGLWERPEFSDEWEVPEDEVSQTLEDAMSRFDVWKLYADPPHWTETVGSWSAKWPDKVEEWWTARQKPMAYALREFTESIESQVIQFGGSDSDCAALLDHMGNAGRKELRIKDDAGEPLCVMQKQDGRLEYKFDAAMAAALSWKARLDAIKSGARPRKRNKTPRRIR